MATGAQVWSQVAATNASIDTNINFAEGQAPSSLNDSCRAGMASVAKWISDNNGVLLTSGTTTALTLVTNQVEGALTAGYTVRVQFPSGVGAAATLAVDGLAAKPIQVVPGTNVIGTEYVANSYASLIYSSTGTGQWIANTTPINNFTPTSYSAVLGSNVTNNSTTVYTEGPNVSVGTTGIWLVNAWTTVSNGSGSAAYFLRIVDSVAATQIAASGSDVNFAAGVATLSNLSGILTNPTSNIQLQIRSFNAGVTFTMNFNATGGAADTGLTAVRIG